MSAQSYGAWRSAFIARLQAEGVTATRARIILAAANRLQKIAADDCSDEAAYLLMEQQRCRCPECERAEPAHARAYTASNGKKRLCGEHRAETDIRDAIRGTSIVAVDFSGDPRGCVVKLKLASGYGDSFGDPSWFCVPAREY